MESQSGEPGASIIREHGSFQVYIRSLGNRQELVLPFLRQWIGGYETLAAIRYKVEQDIELVQPTLISLAEHTAEAVAARLVGWGADAAAYHDQDMERPCYDHNRYGVTLLEVGRDRQAVNMAVQEILGINHHEATTLIDSAPMPILQNVSVQDAIDAHKRLLNVGAKCDLTSPELAWMDTSTNSIPRDPGPFLVIIQHIGLQTLMVDQVIGDLLSHLSEGERQDMQGETPFVLLRSISLETAELVKLKMENFGATVIIQETAERQGLGESIHRQNPAFRHGDCRIVLDGYQDHRKIFVIQELRQLLPGSRLTELTVLIAEMPSVAIEGVDRDSAVWISERLEAAGALVTIQTN